MRYVKTFLGIFAVLMSILTGAVVVVTVGYYIHPMVGVVLAIAMIAGLAAFLIEWMDQL